MIVVRVRGGLGNQLFQYAAARALAHRLGVKVGINRLAYHEGYGRNFELAAYRIVAEELPRSQLPPTPRHRLRRKIWTMTRGQTFFQERQLSFDEQVLSLGDRTYLEGYFLSERYFVDAEPVLRGELVLRRPPSPTIQRIMDGLDMQTTVALHVRRGDYASMPGLRKAFGLLPVSYYQEAVRTIAARMDIEPKVLVFSDEPEWARTNLTLPFATTIVPTEEGRSAAEDLALMSACRHQVIANSTFSWWGAWLNRSPDKVVVAPKRWFADSPYDTSTIVPEGWLKI